MAENTQSPQTPQNPQGHSPAASPAGQGQPAIKPQYDIGAFNGLGVDPSRVVAMSQSKQAADTVTTHGQTVTPPNGQTNQQGTEGTQVATRQLTEKDGRHFAQFVTKSAQEKYDLAKLAIESDKDAIYKIAETDKELAQRLLKEYDYEADSVEALLEKKELSKSTNPQEAQKELEHNKRLQNMEKQLLEEKILRLKGENSDLNGEVEKTFREIYNDPAMSKYSEAQKLAIAKSVSGQQSTQTSADNVALAVLQREQGIATSPKGAAQTEKMKVISPEMKKMLSAANLTEKSLDILPPNIEELIANQFGAFGQ